MNRNPSRLSGAHPYFFSTFKESAEDRAPSFKKSPCPFQMEAGSRMSGWRITRLWLCFVLAVWLATLSIRPAWPSDKPFNRPANWGGSGLFEIPNARVLDDGDMRLGHTHADPYNQLVLNLGVLPRVEFNLRYTEIDGISADLGPDFGDYKDKAFDVKLQLLNESRRFPAIAVGLQDFHGTRLFSAQYLTVNRQIFPLDFTLGFGRQRLKGPAELPFWDEVGLFGGIQWAINDRLSAALEYSPVEYEKDSPIVRTKTEGAASPWNFGLRFNVTPGFTLGLSYQRGETLALSGHLTFSMGKPILPKRPDPPNWNFLIHDPRRHTEAGALVKDAAREIRKTGNFSNISVWTTEGEIHASVQNSGYLSNTMAVGRVMRILLGHADRQTRQLTVNLSRRGIDVLSVTVGAGHLRNYLTGKLSRTFFKELIQVRAAVTGASRTDPTAEATDAAPLLADYGIKPTIETFFDQTDADLKTRWSIEPYATLQTWKGSAWTARINVPVYSDITPVELLEDIPEDEVFRSDAWKYAESTTNLEQLMVDQVIKLTDRTYGRLSLGYLERMYAGAGAELLLFAGDGRFAFGLSGDRVRKREPETLFELQELESHTLLGNIYYYYSPLNITLQTQAGRFLAGDKGLRFVFSRRYDTGARVGFWYSLTDTDDLSGFNKDYYDKGIYIQLPVEMFTDRPSRKRLDYQMSPWTRDVGATVIHFQSLYGFCADLTPARFFDEFHQFSR
jgi:hypothetical protein